MVSLPAMMKSDNNRAMVAVLYPPIASLPPKLLDVVLGEVRPMVIPAGTVLFDEASACNAFPMVLKGAIRVVKAAPNGRELELYQVGPGESCIMSVSCLLGMRTYSARGVAGSDVARPPFMTPSATVLTRRNAMKSNVGTIDRTLRVLVGVALLSFLGIAEGNLRWIGLLGIVPLATALLGFCPLYSLLGISSCRIGSKGNS